MTIKEKQTTKEKPKRKRIASAKKQDGFRGDWKKRGALADRPLGVTLIRRPLPPPPLPPPEQQVGVRFLTKKEVLARTQLSYPTIWKKMQEGTFPRARYAGPSKTMWIASEIEAWIFATPLRAFKGDRQEGAA